MDPAFATILGTILGALLAGPVTYFFTKKMMQRQQFYKAASVFRSVFVDEIIICREIASEELGEDLIGDVITSAIGKHERAMILFRPHLDNSLLVGFDKAWNEYSCRNKSTELNNNPILSEYGTTFDIKEEKKMRHLVHSRIERLFEFASMKN